MDFIKWSVIFALELIAGFVAAFMAHDVGGPDFFNAGIMFAGAVALVVAAATTVSSVALGVELFLMARARADGREHRGWLSTSAIHVGAAALFGLPAWALGAFAGSSGLLALLVAVLAIGCAGGALAALSGAVAWLLVGLPRMILGARVRSE